MTARTRDRAVPALPARAFDETEAFYAGFGFVRVFRDAGWMILARGGLELEFFPPPRRRSCRERRHVLGARRRCR